MISDDYKAQLKSLRDSTDTNYHRTWGKTGRRNFGPSVVGFLQHNKQIVSVLDFGAGQGTLGNFIKEELPRIEWTDYDPGMPGIDETPTGLFDLIVSSDVLEHIEPDQIANVVDWLCKHARRCQYHHIACGPAGGTLPDGRDKHLIQEDVTWWVKTFERANWVIQLHSDTYKRKRGKYSRSCQLQLDNLVLKG